MLGLGNELDHDAKRLLAKVRFWFYVRLTMVLLYIVAAAVLAGFREYPIGQKIVAFVAYCAAVLGAAAVLYGVRAIYHGMKA